jgi:hypothetical protein
MTHQERTVKWQDLIGPSEESDKSARRQQTIDEEFGGDPEKYDYYLTLGRAHTLDWNQLVATSEHLPELEGECKSELLWRLGYEANEACMLPHLPFMCRLLDSYKKGQINQAQYEAEFSEHVRQVRNEDMHRSGWAYFLQPKPESLRFYETDDVTYRHAARARLTRFLGYEPSLPSSLEAELALRRQMARSQKPNSDKLAQFDVRMIVVIQYREILIESGRKAADASPLFDWTSLRDTGLPSPPNP